MGISLPSPRRFRGEGEHYPVDNLIAELERSGFRSTAFEAKPKQERPATPTPVPAEKTPPREPLLPLDDAESQQDADADEDYEPAADTLGGETDDDEAESDAADDGGTGGEDEDTDDDSKSNWDSEDEGLMALFDEASEYYRAPLVIREAIPECTIDELLEDARSLRRLLGGAGRTPTP
jgi:hypothetical protein